jgi:hypothetical protein
MFGKFMKKLRQLRCSGLSLSNLFTKRRISQGRRSRLIPSQNHIRSEVGLFTQGSSPQKSREADLGSGLFQVGAPDFQSGEQGFSSLAASHARLSAALSRGIFCGPKFHLRTQPDFVVAIEARAHKKRPAPASGLCCFSSGIRTRTSFPIPWFEDRGSN